MATRWLASATKKQHHREPPSLPVELWFKIFGYLPQPDQVACLLVSRRFYHVCSHYAFRSMKFHMDTTYFDRCNARYIHRSSHVREMTTVKQSQEAFQYICSNPPWAGTVERVVVFVRDSSNPAYFQLATAALQRFPRLREFHVVVTKWHHGESVHRLDKRPIQAFVTSVLAANRNLQILTLPPMLVHNLLFALLNMRTLRQVYLREELDSPSAVLPRSLAQEVSHIFSHPNMRVQPLGTPRLLSELCIEESILHLIPREVLRYLKQLEVLNITGLSRLEPTLEQCKYLEALTVHELVGYSTCLTHTGLQLDPQEQDWPIQLHNGHEPHRVLHVLAHRHDILPHLTAFKYVQYETILPVEICGYFETFLSKRPLLQMVDINSVLTNVEMARKIVRVIHKMHHLRVLGLEYRSPRDAFADVDSLQAELPQTLSHLRFAVHGWNLYDCSESKRISIIDGAVTQALNALPGLTFLHLSDGVERPIDAEPDATSLDISQLKDLTMLGLEHCWYNVVRNIQRPGLVAWDPRAVCWHMYVKKMEPQAEWLMRYHRDVRGPI